MRNEVKEWEKGLVNPLLWKESIWNDVTREIYRDLINNRKVSCFIPRGIQRRKIVIWQLM